MNGWISVKDSMPEQFTEVIIFTTKGNVTCAYLDEEDWMHEEDERVADWNIGEVTHWQSLPKPPKTIINDNKQYKYSKNEQQMIKLIQEALLNNEDFRSLMAEYVNASIDLISEMLRYIKDELERLE